MSQPIYQGPAIDPEMPWAIRHHIQLFYQRLGVADQAFALLKKQLDEMVTSVSGTSGIVSVGGGGTGSMTLPPSEVLLGNGASPLMGVPSVSPGYVLADAGPGLSPGYKFPFVSAPQYAYANLPGSPTLGQVVCVTDATVNTWGAVISTGGGTHFVLAWFNASNWVVIGI